MIFRKAAENGGFSFFNGLRRKSKCPQKISTLPLVFEEKGYRLPANSTRRRIQGFADAGMITKKDVQMNILFLD
jgi:hypothetical protein